uniref:Multicopper oxidase n=1 Tax=Ganoderma boninense TaxID=34458 RepID=A0A5K1JSI5_9APHY|nr:Multicopper oxidase [Ganoderma boninense]
MADRSSPVSQPTQAATQTQLASQQHHIVEDTNLWGFLIPCNSNNPHISRINFHKPKKVYTLGRTSRNDIRLPKCQIVSSKHCVFQWDGVEDPSASAVTVTDFSSNGTFINGVRIAEPNKPQSRILYDGNEISFGSCLPRPIETAHEDYRFIFRKRRPGAAADSLDESYDIQHVLGSGSFATVVKALHRTEGQWYAVKIVQQNKLRQGILGERRDFQQKALVREIDIMKRLHHPNICRYKDVFIEEDNVSESEVQYFTYQICEALHYVHEMGIAHRDLKPDNILLTDDKPPIVKVADFGLAKMVDSVTFLHTMCGTPEYLAPEVVKNTERNERYDKVVDSWSMGVIVFALLTMCTPFVEFPEGTDVATQIANRQVEWAVLHKFHVSESCEDFVRKLLDLDPTTRMTLTDARAHPWLAEQAAAASATKDNNKKEENEEGPVVTTQPSQEEDLDLAQSRASLPPDTQYDVESEEPSNVGPEVSMRSLGGPSHLALGLMSVALGTSDPEPQPPQVQYDQREGDGNGHGPIETPPHVEGNNAEEREDNGAEHQGQQDDGSQPHTVQRRADVIRRAQHKGIELPAPSQVMEARAAEELDVVDVSVDPIPQPGASTTSTHLSAVPASRADGKRKATELYPEYPVAPGDGSNAAMEHGHSARGPKRGRESESELESREGGGITAAVDRSPSAKKARTSGEQLEAAAAVTGEEEELEECGSRLGCGRG